MNPRPDLERLLAAYAQAIESRSIAEIRRAYPGLTGEQQRGWELFFAAVRSVEARLTMTALEVSGTRAEFAVSGWYQYDGGRGRSERRPESFRATAELDGGAWRLRTIR